MKLALIGIGTMGMAMAKNLHRKGFSVHVRDIRPDDAAAIKT